MMIRKDCISAAAIALALLSASVPAGAQNGSAPDLLSILSQLQQNPAYAGQIVGTQAYRPDPQSDRVLYQVRILRPDDQIIVIYIDPATGQVVNPN